MTRRSYWAWGLETDEPTFAERQAAAARLSERHGRDFEAKPILPAEELGLRAPRVAIPTALASVLTVDAHERASHTYGKGFLDKVRAVRGLFPNPVDIVAYPETEADVVAVLEWADQSGGVAIPYGGGSSVVGGVEAPEGGRPAVSIDMTKLDKVLELDETSRAARIQAGVLGPALEDQQIGRAHV